MTPDAYLLISLVALAGWVAWLWHMRASKSLEIERARLDVIGRTIDKFSSSEEFLTFLASDQAKSLLGSPPARASTASSILRFVQLGAIAIVLGLALFWSAARLARQTDAHSIQQREERSYWALCTLGLGGGFVAAGGISYVFARRLQVLRAANKD